MCENNPAQCRTRRCGDALNFRDMDAHTDADCQYKEVGVCQKGCGLVLLQRDVSDGDHCCVRALRAENGALLLRSARLQHEALKRRARWDAREQHLLAQVTSLHNEARLTAVTHQKKLQQYMLHINDITKQLIGLCKDDPQLDPGAGGVSVSHISEREPAGQREGLQAKDRVPQVNGKDISKATHEEAVEAFRSAKDPIVVQVLRRNPVSRSHGNTQEARLVDVCTQTDITFEHIMALAKLRPTTPPVPDICPFLLSDSCHSLQTMDHEFYEGTDYLSPIPADIERTDEFEYEEVELCRLSSQEKLGLTLCYRTDDEEDIAIYVSKVGPNSIAARDGRIREGDRILQINGQDVQDREEAVTMLSSEVCGNVVLLVARPEMQLDEGWLDDEQNELLEELKMEILEEQRKEEAQLVASTSKQPRRPEEDDITTDTATCSSNNQDKDSGVCRTDDSGRHDDTSEQEVLARVQRRLSQCLRERRGRGRGVGTPANSREGRGNRPPLKEEDEEEEAEEEGEREGGEGEEGRFRQLLELKCQIRNSGEYDLFYSRRSTIECSLAQQEEGVQEGVQRELRLLNEELRSIEQECQNIMQAHQLRLAQDQSPDRRPGGGKDRRAAGPKLADITEHPERSDKDSSSAYNTAESSRSTPLAIERSPDHSLQRIVRLTNQKNLRSSALAKTATATAPQDERDPAGSDPPSTPPTGEDDRLHCSKLAPYPSPYHGAPYRHPSIPAHARHYQSYMQLIQQSSAVEYGQSQLSLLSVCKDLQPHRPAEPKAEWKVKVRSDGTRYITKRPVRDRLLRERALKIREERSGGTTTDDDAASELKMGRYWSKEERKQHLLRAKEQRRRREFMMRSRLESLRESPQSGGEGGSGGRKEVSILELSHRKMMKKRNRKILDNWMTIQELMTHGARAPEDPQVHNAFLSVTTV
ncbi:PDZ domain-containing RING finger protein 4-like isoform X1 [Anguilla anguilla]|uniref:PDZ domain-containing RING finger protein 4-like isoform X1 n=1 Tax=Anguilla anguilla TaxID=7936 RepID=UPI0015AD6590|nr:PDZ domain-containing RING finger protein 4-like isoform X1 [Anguilla anguilla]